jgi:hypothetical protein
MTDKKQDLLSIRSLSLSISKRAEEDGSESVPGNMVLEFPFSSESPYLRQSFNVEENKFDDPWVEILGHKDGEIDLSRLNDGAPVLLNHGASKTEESALRSIGKTVRAWVQDGRGYVEVKLSRRAGMEGLLQDIQDEIVQNVSVGYQILERTLVSHKEGMPDEYRVTKWLPMEVTLCDIPADATVGLGRSIDINGDKEMEQRTDEAVVTQPAIDVDAIRSAAKADAVKQERQRASDIRVAVRSAGLDMSYADELIDGDVTVDAARAQVLEKLAARTESAPISSRADIFTTVDETETRRSLMTEAVLYRANPSAKLSDGARQYAGLSMIDIAKECLDARGVKYRGMDRLQIVSRAFEGNSDLPNVLANVANKSLRQAYESAPRTFTPWARQTTAPDFKLMSKVSLSDAPALEKVTENGEFKRGAVTDGKETYQLATYGKIIGLTRQAIINDDLSAFTRIPAMFATAAANLESDTVYGILTANAALSDTVALFHAASHFNYTSSGTVISIDSLGVAKKLMRLQKTPKGVVMNLTPKFLIVPAQIENVGWQYTTPEYNAATAATVNPFRGQLQLIVEPRLDASSGTAWYMAADSNMVDTIEYCYLEGQNGVYIETRQGFDVDGMEIKARLDFAAKAIDYRGLYKNVGA